MFRRAGASVEGAGKGSVNRPVRSIRERVFHMVISPVLSAIGQIEGFVDQGEIRNDVAEDRVLDQWPVLPGRIVCMAAPDAAVRASFESNHHRTAPSFDQADPKTIRLRERNCGLDGVLRKIQREAHGRAAGIRGFRRSALARARPRRPSLHDKLWYEQVIGRPRMVHAQVAGNARSAPDQANGTELFGCSCSKRPASRKRSCSPACSS